MGASPASGIEGNPGLARGGLLPLEWKKIVLLSRLTALGRKSVPEIAVQT
jgi:hypothetical protein